MKKLLIIILLFILPLFLFAKSEGNFGLSFGPSASYYDIDDANVFSNELAIRLNGSNKIGRNWKVQYALTFNYPSLCFINWNNVGLINRLTDFTTEIGFGYILPAHSRVIMDAGLGLSFYMGSRPGINCDRVYQYGLNLDAFYSTLFEINPVFGITLELRVSTPLYLYSTTINKKHSTFSGVSALGSVGFVYLYSN